MEEVEAPLPKDEPCSGRYSKKESLTLKDAVTLKFDDGKEYYVASDFLGMASSVFRTMLDAEFKEKQTGVIELKGKNSDDFLELLEFLHPAVHKRITEDTVFKIIPLAEEYDIKTAILDCRDTLITILEEQDDVTKPVEPASNSTPWNYSGHHVRINHCDAVLKCIEILQIANIYNYTDVEALALSIISRFPSTIYLWKARNHNYANKECVEHYSKLQEHIKIAILEKRLKEYDGSGKWPIKS